MTPIEHKARELLAAYDDAVIELFSDEETGSNVGNCRAACRRRIRRIRAILEKHLITALTPPAGGLPELPELPEPVAYRWGACLLFPREISAGQIASVEHLYTAAQLHAYALEAIAASRVGWLPIESAPEGTEDVLLWDGGGVMVGFRMRPHRRWFARDESTEDLSQVFPTHWQPLPAAPQVALNRED